MTKILIIGMLLYAAYKIYLPKGISGPDNERLNDNEDGYTDYEEVD